MAKVTSTVFISGDPEAVFDVITTAKYWTQWHPATLSVSGHTEYPMRAGDTICERALIAGREVENYWTVTQVERPRKLQLDMPGTSFGNLAINYKFVARDNGVVFSRDLVFDDNEYPLPHREALEHQMDNDSHIATNRIKLLVETLLGTRVPAE